MSDSGDGPKHPGDNNDSSNEQGGDRVRAVQELGQTNFPPKIEGGIHCLTIIGQVEGHLLLPPKNKTTKYEHVIPQLVAVEQNPSIRGLMVILNTVGGDIEAGLAIAEMIRSLSKPTVSLVLGGGHSIGTPIAVAARRTFIAGTASMTLHPIRLTGLVIGVPQTYDYLDKMQDRVIRFIVDNSQISEPSLRDLMFRTGELVRDVGTVLIGAEAVQAGLVHEVGGLASAMTALRAMIDEERAGGQNRPNMPGDPRLPSLGPPGFQPCPQGPGVPSSPPFQPPFAPPPGGPSGGRGYQ